MGRIICIANQKGGVGKTTTAVNLSAALALAGHPTLLLDMDPQGSASSGVGVRAPAGDARTIYDALLGACSITEAISPTSVASLSVVPASRDLIGAEVELVTEQRREQRLKEAVASIRWRYDFVLVDCPPSLGVLTLNGMTCADSVLVPLQCEYYALEGLTALLETIQLVRENLNPDLAIEGFLLTMYDRRNTLCRQVAEEVRSHFPERVFRTVIPRNVRLSESPSHGLPALLYDASSRGARSYVEFAAEIMSGNSGAP